MKSFTAWWNILCHLGTQHLPDHDRRKKICIGINKIALSVIIVNALTGIPCYYFTKSLPLLLGCLLEIFLMSIPLMLNYKKRYWWASMNLYLLMAGATFYFGCKLGKLAEMQLSIIYLIGVSLFMFSDRKRRIICVLIALALLSTMELNFKHGFISELEATENIRDLIRWTSYLTIIFLVIFTFDLFANINRDLFDSLKDHVARVAKNLKKEELENKTKDKFISNATHEMRVSFYAIFSVIGILYKVEKKPGNNEFKRSLDDLRAACKYSKSIIDNILEYERFKAGLTSEVLNQLVDIRVLVTNIVEINRYIADEKRVQINLVIAENLSHHIICDEVKLRQIITNLLHNAIKFTWNNTCVNVLVSKIGRSLTISIQDNGGGIEEENKKAIFEPFVTKNPDGLGLGLYIVRELVDAFQGKIEVLNNPGGGSTFTISLPLPETVSHTSAVLSLS